MQIIPLQNPQYILSRFCLCGISYQKADADIRGLFYINDEIKDHILNISKKAGVRSLFILSTCNRTELYGYVSDATILSNIFIAGKQLDEQLFYEKSYIKKGTEALHHLFSVAAGLDSQIIGDYEITAQLKQAVAFSQKMDMIGPIMDRTINYTLQASKKIKTTTSISSGTTSVSFAAINWLKNNSSIENKQIILIGLGKFGSVLGKRLKHYFPNSLISVCNRTNENAMQFAKENKLQFTPYESLSTSVNNADIIIVSTNAIQPIVLSEFLTIRKQRIFLDLSIPYNVDPGIKNIPLQQVVNVDDVSIILNNIIEKRKNEIPKALNIISEKQNEFITWLASYCYSTLVREMKDKLYALSKTANCHEIGKCFQYNEVAANENTINKTISRLAINLRTKNEKGCQFIDAYNHFFIQQNDK